MYFSNLRGSRGGALTALCGKRRSEGGRVHARAVEGNGSWYAREGEPYGWPNSVR